MWYYFEHLIHNYIIFYCAMLLHIKYYTSIAVTLSKTKKKGREHKEQLVNAIRQSVEDYTSTYVFRFENMRNLKFKNFREQLKSNSRFVLSDILRNLSFSIYICIFFIVSKFQFCNLAFY